MKKERNRVFVSYAHRDRRHLDRLRVHLRTLGRSGLIDLWDDTLLQPGSDWRREISDAIASAKVAVLLVSADFLASEFITGDELPPLLAAAREEGARVLPVIVSPCRFKQTSELANFRPPMFPNGHSQCCRSHNVSVFGWMWPTRSGQRSSVAQGPRAGFVLKIGDPARFERVRDVGPSSDSSAPGPKRRERSAAAHQQTW